MSALGTVKRADTVGALPALTNTATHIGSLGLVTDNGTGAVGIYEWSGTAWGAAILGGGSLSALAGDANGSPSNNTVDGLHGAGGVVRMQGTEIRFDGSLTVQPATNGAGAGFNARFAAGAGTGAAGGQAQVFGGTGSVPGSVQLASASGQKNLTISSTTMLSTIEIFEFSTNLGSDAIIRVGAGAGASIPLDIKGRSSSDNTGGNVDIASGDGFDIGHNGMVRLICGHLGALSVMPSSPKPIVQFEGNTVRWSETSSPFLGQVQRTTNSLPQPMRFRSQDPFNDPSTTGNNRLAGNIEMEIAASVNGADNLGHYLWSIAEAPVMACWEGRTELYNAELQFVKMDGSGAVIDFNDAVDLGGASLTIMGQRGGITTPSKGGSIYLQGGPPSIGFAGGGVIAKTGADGRAMLQLVQLGAQFFNCIGFNAELALGDVPVDTSNVVLLADAYNLDSVIAGVGPTAASLIASASGRPLLQCANGGYILFEGVLHSGPAGALIGLLDVEVNGLPGCIEVKERS